MFLDKLRGAAVPLLCAATFAGAAGCQQANSVVPLRISLQAGSSAVEPVIERLQADINRMDPNNRVEWGGFTGSDLTIRLQRVEQGQAIVDEGYQLTGVDGDYLVSAVDAAGLQYGVWDILERAGIYYIHPREILFADELCVADCLGTVDEIHAPVYDMRGTHVHTMHPIELESTLLGHDPVTLERFDEFLAWLVARRQNYVEWNLLRTVEFDKWIGHAGDLVALAHDRGVKVGIVAPIAFRQQNSFFLVDLEDPAKPTDQLAASVDRLMAVPWDHINVEMGASEFFSISDQDQVSWLSFLANYLDAEYPGTKTATKVHCTVNQTADSYDGMNFNYIAAFADPGMGVMPHTVQWYDLYRAGPTYDRQDFTDMREFLLQEIGKRDVFYYPETAYWVTFDNDVPLFLPQYTYARWNDLARLAESGMDGQINFSSGWEWGYWLNDLAAAAYAYEPGDDYLDPLRPIFRSLGDAGDESLALFAEVVEWQGSELLEANGIRWLIAWDAADDVGHFADIHGQPIRTRLYELAETTPTGLQAFAAEFEQLSTIANQSRLFADRWWALESDVAAGGERIWREIALGLEITALRAAFMTELYRAVMLEREFELDGDAADQAAAALALVDAEALLQQGLTVAGRANDIYRYPFDEIAVDRPSLTSYPFGYLRTVPDLWYWQRDLNHASDPRGFNYLESLYDLVESGGF